MRKGRDGGNGKKTPEKTDENSGHYVISSSRPPERRPLERRTLAPKSFSVISFLCLIDLLGDNVAKVTVVDTPGFGNNVTKEEDTIENLVKILRDDIKHVHVFIIAFKQNDNRMTHSLRSMISLFVKMFGHKFWDNVILEVSLTISTEYL